MKNKAILMLLVLFIFCVGCVSATDTDNNTIPDNQDNSVADEIDIEKNNINSTNEPNNIDNDDNSKNKIENNNLTENNNTSTKNNIKRYFEFNITSFDPNVKVNITEGEEENIIIEIHTNTTLKNNNIRLDIDSIKNGRGLALKDGHLKFGLKKLGPGVMFGGLYRAYDFNIGTHNISVFFNQTGDYEKVFTITLHSNNTNYTQPVPDWYKEHLKDIEREKNLPDYEERTMTNIYTNETVICKLKRIKAKDACIATMPTTFHIPSIHEPKILNIQMSNKSNVISKNIQINNKNKSPIVKLTLNKIVPKKSGKKITIKAKLTINDKKIKGKSVKIKFNNKIYDVKTDKNGIAKINIKKSVLKKLKAGKKIKYQAIYGKTTTTQTAKVKN